MRRHTLGIIGGVLVVVGLIGAVAVALLASSGRYTTPSAGGPGSRGAPRGGRQGQRGGGPNSFSSPGQRIFLSGVGHAGAIPRQGGFGMMARGGCANCHGEDGKGGRIGGMMGGGVTVPDIRYTTLTSPKSDEGTSEPAWSDAQIESAIREGKDPDGGTLSTYMPRWQMDDTDMAELLAYLKELK